LNAAGYTFTSIAILDALKAVSLPVVLDYLFDEYGGPGGDSEKE